MLEVLRKLGLVANWIIFGGAALVLTVLAMNEDLGWFSFAIMLGILVVGLIVHKTINWIFTP